MTEATNAPVFLQLDVEALEDLHTGTGTGNGDIDAVVQRDRQGRPVIRSSHLKGLLREAGEDLIGFGQLTSEALDCLLGKPGQGRCALRLTSLRVREGGKTLTWGSTKRVEKGRAPEEDTLRYVEYVAAATVFSGELRLSDAQYQPLLERLLNRVDRIGGDRNRGSGLVRLNWATRSAPTGEPVKTVAGPCLRLVLRNLEPLSLPTTGHPGNLIQGNSFIRGPTLRGALMAWAIRQRRLDDLGLFQKVSIGDALPLPEGYDAVGGLMPIPLSILTEKPRAASADIPWWATGSAGAQEFDSLGETKDPDEKPKRPGVHEYLCRQGGKGPWLRYTPTMQVRLRNATPKKGKQADAELFSLEEIAEDTRFQAELRFHDDAAAAEFIVCLTPLLCRGDWLAIGRGGQPAIIESIAAVDAQSATHAISTNDWGDDWCLTLVSDLIVRGEYLGFLDGLDLDWLCKWTGVPKQGGWSIKKAVVETETIHGFNAASGLRSAPVLAIRRGSCWRITGAGSTALAAALVQKPAIGERICEGFGRFVIDAQPIRLIARPDRLKAEPLGNRNEELLSLARRLAKKIAHDGPSLSQLQWLREQVMAAQTDSELDDLIKEVETAPDRRPQGGKAWSAMQPLKLRQEIDKLQSISEKRTLISYVVQWLVPSAKEKRK